MSFSPDDKFFLSVSRDRTWCLFKNVSKEEGEILYDKVAFTDKKSAVHSRIIWGCDWSSDSKFFATCSRDKKVAIWTEGTHDSGIAGLGKFRLGFSPEINYYERLPFPFLLEDSTIMCYLSRS